MIAKNHDQDCNIVFLETKAGEGVQWRGPRPRGLAETRPQSSPAPEDVSDLSLVKRSIEYLNNVRS